MNTYTRTTVQWKKNNFGIAL